MQPGRAVRRPSTVTRLARQLCTSVVGVLLLTGCSGSPEPEASPSVSSSSPQVTVSGQPGAPSVVPSLDRCGTVPQAAAAGRTARFDHVVLQVPQGWYAVDVCFTSAGAIVPLGYLTTQVPGAQCRHRPARPPGPVGCGPPVVELGSGDVVVVVSVSPPISRHPRADAVIAGCPALLDRHAPRRVAGSRTAVEAVVECPDAPVVSVTAYLGAAADAERAAVLRMLHTATYAR